MGEKTDRTSSQNNLGMPWGFQDWGGDCCRGCPHEIFKKDKLAYRPGQYI